MSGLEITKVFDLISLELNKFQVLKKKELLQGKIRLDLRQNCMTLQSKDPMLLV
jgi:hypothetical protein